MDAGLPGLAPLRRRRTFAWGLGTTQAGPREASAVAKVAESVAGATTTAGSESVRSYTSFDAKLLYAGAGAPMTGSSTAADDAGRGTRPRLDVDDLTGLDGMAMRADVPQHGAEYELESPREATDVRVVASPQGPLVRVAPRRRHDFDVAETMSLPRTSDADAEAALAPFLPEHALDTRFQRTPASSVNTARSRLYDDTKSSQARKRARLPRQRPAPTSRSVNSKSRPASTTRSVNSSKSRLASTTRSVNSSKSRPASAAPRSVNSSKSRLRHMLPRRSGQSGRPGARHGSSSRASSVQRPVDGAPRPARPAGTFGSAKTGRGEGGNTYRPRIQDYDRQSLFLAATKADLVDRVMELQAQLATAVANHDITRAEAVRATKTSQAMEHRLRVAEGRMRVLVDTISTTVKAMLRFKFEGDALALGLKGDDRCTYAEQEAEKQLHTALGPVLTDLSEVLQTDLTGTASPRLAGGLARADSGGSASRASEEEDAEEGETMEGVEGRVSPSPRADRAVAVFRDAAFDAVAAVKQSVSDMHAQRERGIDLCEELGISLESRNSAAAALNHALLVERSARQEALAEASKHVEEKSRLQAQVEQLQATIREQHSAYARKIELTAGVLEEFANQVHGDIRKHFGYVPRAMEAKVAKLAPLLARDGGADLVLRYCVRNQPDGIATGAELLAVADLVAPPTAVVDRAAPVGDVAPSTAAATETPARHAGTQPVLSATRLEEAGAAAGLPRQTTARQQNRQTEGDVESFSPWDGPAAPAMDVVEQSSRLAHPRVPMMPTPLPRPEPRARHQPQFRPSSQPRLSSPSGPSSQPRLSSPSGPSSQPRLSSPSGPSSQPRLSSPAGPSPQPRPPPSRQLPPRSQAPSVSTPPPSQETAQLQPLSARDGPVVARLPVQVAVDASMRAQDWLLASAPLSDSAAPAVPRRPSATATYSLATRSGVTPLAGAVLHDTLFDLSNVRSLSNVSAADDVYYQSRLA